MVGSSHSTVPSQFALLVLKQGRVFFFSHMSILMYLLLGRISSSLFSGSHLLALSLEFWFFTFLSSTSLPLPPSPHDPASNTGCHVSRAGSIQAHLLHVLYNESYITCLLTAVAACNFSCLEHKYNYKQMVPFTNSRGWYRSFSSTPYGDINQAVIWSVIAAAINTLHRLVMLLCLHTLGHVSYS